VRHKNGTQKRSEFDSSEVERFAINSVLSLKYYYFIWPNLVARFTESILMARRLYPLWSNMSWVIILYLYTFWRTLTHFDALIQ